MRCRTIESFHIVLGQGRIFGRCCNIAVSSEDGKKKNFRHFHVNNHQEGITEVSGMIIINMSHACILLRWSAEEGCPIIETFPESDTSTFYGCRRHTDP